MVETKATEGYILDETVHEIVLQYDDVAPEVVTYTLNITNKSTEPKLPQTGNKFNSWLGAGAMLAGVGAFLWREGKRRSN